MTKIKAMRPRRSGYTIFPQKDRRKLSNEHDYRLFCLFLTNRYTVYYTNSAPEHFSVHSRIRIGPKRTQLPPISAYSHSRIVPKERVHRHRFPRQNKLMKLCQAWLKYCTSPDLSLISEFTLTFYWFRYRVCLQLPVHF